MELITTPTNLDYLISSLRLHISDTTEPYTYTDEELRTRLVNAVKTLMYRWNYKYIIDENNNATRNPNVVFLFPEPPTIQYADEIPIVLQASIDIKSAVLFNTANTTGASWKDDEISFSNNEGLRALSESLQRDKDILEGILPTARERLAQPKKQSLPGFTPETNPYEGSL